VFILTEVLKQTILDKAYKLCEVMLLNPTDLHVSFVNNIFNGNFILLSVDWIDLLILNCV
jgi:hypothetical protein